MGTDAGASTLVAGEGAHGAVPTGRGGDGQLPPRKEARPPHLLVPASFY